MHALTNVCMLNRINEIILLVQEDKRFMERGDPEPQLIAEAVAAYQFDNRQLRFSRHPLSIPMIRSTPISYEIKVTAALVECIPRLLSIQSWQSLIVISYLTLFPLYLQF